MVKFVLKTKREKHKNAGKLCDVRPMKSRESGVTNVVILDVRHSHAELARGIHYVKKSKTKIEDKVQ